MLREWFVIQPTYEEEKILNILTRCLCLRPDNGIRYSSLWIGVDVDDNCLCPMESEMRCLAHDYALTASKETSVTSNNPQVSK